MQRRNGKRCCGVEHVGQQMRSVAWCGGTSGKCLEVDEHAAAREVVGLTMRVKGGLPVKHECGDLYMHMWVGVLASNLHWSEKMCTL